MVILFNVLSIIFFNLSLNKEIIYLQPYNSFTVEEAENVKKDIELHFPNILNKPFKVYILPTQKLPEYCLNYNKSRFRADSILHFEYKTFHKKGFLIGLTHDDISYTLHGKNDYGIYGMSDIHRPVCIVSTYRLHKNEPFWVLLEHEFIHTYYHYHHCPSDNPHCIMQDGHGSPHLERKSDLCNDCKIRLKLQKK